MVNGTDQILGKNLIDRYVELHTELNTLTKNLEGSFN